MGNFVLLIKYMRMIIFQKYFKECLSVCFNYDINKELLDKEMLPIKHLFNRDKKSINSYSYKLKSFFDLPESYITNSGYGKKINSNYIPIEKKELAANYLIRIIPEQNLSSSNRQRKLFNLYEIFTNKSYDKFEIKNNLYNDEIWRSSNKYIFKFIRKEIEKHENLKSLEDYICKNEEETLNYLLEFIKYSKEGRVILNQNDQFCQRDQLQNDEFENNAFIPDILKDIYKLLGVDIRNSLAHNRMNRPCEKALTFQNICVEIDEKMSNKYNEPKNHSDPDFKKASSCFIEEYFEKIGDEEAKKNFPLIYKLKDPITLNVIFNKETRQSMTKFGKLYDNEDIEKLIKNNEIVKKILNNTNILNKIKNDDISDQTYSSIEKFSDFDDDSKSMSITFSSTISSNLETLNEYKEYIRNIFTHIDFINSVNLRTGRCGEAYIYEYLRNSGLYKNVKWNMLSQDSNGELLEYRNNTYLIKKEGAPYDIEIETYDNRTIYVEVKSTRHEFGNKIPFYISEHQINAMRETLPPNKYVLAIVFDVMNHPRHFFMSLRENIGNLKLVEN